MSLNGYQRIINRRRPGDKLLRWCNSVESNVPCYSYIDGVIDGLHAEMMLPAVEAAHADGKWLRDIDDVDRSFCLGESVTIDQTRRVAIRFLETHPERLHLLAAVLSQNAMLDAFPCAD